MMGDRDDSAGTETTELDSKLSRPRLKESLIPGAAWTFVRIEEGREVGRLFSLSPGGVYLIGRKGADVELQDKKVSRKHAEIGLYGPDSYFIRDLGSTNGVRLNGKRITHRAKLRHGDLISLGDTTLRFAIHDTSIPIS